MNKLYLQSVLTGLCFSASFALYSQSGNIAINFSGNTGNKAAILDLSDTSNKHTGLLLPNVSLVSTTDVTTITSPPTGLMVYNTNASMTGGSGVGFYYYSGSIWEYIYNNGMTPSLGSASAYSILGNNTSSSAAPTYFTPTLASALFKNQGTTTNVLHGNASGNPSWGAVTLTTDVSGILPPANGGSGINNGSNTITANKNVTVAFDSSQVKYGVELCGSISMPTHYTISPGTNGYVFTSNGTNSAPSWKSGTPLDSNGYFNTSNLSSGYLNPRASQSLSVSSKVISWNVQNGSVAYVTLGYSDGTDSISFSHLKNGGVYTLLVTQPSTGSWVGISPTHPHTQTWYIAGQGMTTYAGGNMPALSTNNGGVDKLTFTIINNLIYVDYATHYK